MRGFIFLFLFVFLSLQANLIQAGIEFRKFDNKELEARYNVLTDQLRCLVCQNQNLKGSNSDLAKDMRDKVYTMIVAGKSDQEIIDFMVARYGDFVLYNPPFKTITWMLWLGPLLFFIIALVSVVRIIRQRNKVGAIEELSEEEHLRAQKLLKDALLKKDNTP
jgi:cytochrome c-type biogenesis protein CcmH